MGFLAGLGIAADVLGGILGHDAQSSANRTNVRLQREQRDWEEKMSSSAYQRATQDLAKAGLNPMLAYSQGGASTPNVSAATVQPVDAMARAVGSAGSKAMQTQQLENLAINNKILAEKWAQEKMATERQQVNMGRGSIIDQEGNTVVGQRHWFLDELRLVKAKADLQEIETKVAEQIAGYNVQSAKATAEIKEQEVGLNDIRAILMKLDIPEKEALADWFERVGEASPAAKAVMSIGQWLRLIFGR